MVLITKEKKVEGENHFAKLTLYLDVLSRQVKIFKIRINSQEWREAEAVKKGRRRQLGGWKAVYML